MTKLEFINELMTNHVSLMNSLCKKSDTFEMDIELDSLLYGAKLTRKKETPDHNVFDYIVNSLHEIKSMGLGYLEMIATLFLDLGERKAINNSIDNLPIRTELKNFLKIGRTIAPYKFGFASSNKDLRRLMQSITNIPENDIKSFEYQIKNKGHEEISCMYAEHFMTSLGFDKNEIEIVRYLIKNHMKIYLLIGKMWKKCDFESLRNPEFWRLKYIWLAIYNARFVKEPRINMADLDKIIKSNRYGKLLA